MHVAQPNDFDKIKEYGLEFIKQTEHISKFYTVEYVDALINSMLSAPPESDIILIADGGMIMGKAIPSFLGPYLIATEIAWYVTPEARGKGIGEQLRLAFEYWAEHISKCSAIQMGSLDEDMGKYFEKKGYKLCERAYIKEI